MFDVSLFIIVKIIFFSFALVDLFGKKGNMSPQVRVNSCAKEGPVCQFVMTLEMNSISSN